MPSERLRQGRDALSAVRSRLLKPTPETLVACLPDLERAVRCLEAIEADPPGGESFRQELLEFRQQTREANALLRRAADYYLDCLRLLSSGCGAYGGSGEVLSSIETGRSVAFEA
jgi:hypothetical protein